MVVVVVVVVMKLLIVISFRVVITVAVVATQSCRFRLNCGKSFEETYRNRKQVTRLLSRNQLPFFADRVLTRVTSERKDFEFEITEIC